MAALKRTITEQVLRELYDDALILADEARLVFDCPDSGEGEPDVRIALSIEGLRTTTRLMHDLAWLLNHRAYLAGELSAHQLAQSGRLAEARSSDPRNMAILPYKVRAFIRETERLHERVARLDASQQAVRAANDDPIGNLQGLIAAAFLTP